MAEEVKKNKLKIPLSPEEKRTEIVDVAEEPVAKPKAKKAAAAARIGNPRLLSVIAT